jgi:hypothetical protein
LSENAVDDLNPIPVKVLASTLRRTIYNAWRASLAVSGDQSAVAEAYHERATNPQIGDMVIESSTIHYPQHDLNGVGILVDIADEPVDYGDYVWDEETEGRPHPTERVYYLRTLDGRLRRWENAGIIAAVSGLNDLDLTTDYQHQGHRR